ncbi:hypothetical protein RRF57_011543 [Xylaria bambusicola]|uniref:Uncharacterized protein n=1 Tax=Xylaria bambusicola TaxID=326684 RepID=A0AAN7UZN5_9PEZI
MSLLTPRPNTKDNIILTQIQRNPINKPNINNIRPSRSRSRSPNNLIRINIPLPTHWRIPVQRTLIPQRLGIDPHIRRRTRRIRQAPQRRAINARHTRDESKVAELRQITVLNRRASGIIHAHILMLMREVLAGFRESDRGISGFEERTVVA